MASPAPDHRGRLHVTMLFNEYRSACDDGEPPDLESLLARAGDERDALNQRIDVYQRLHALKDKIDPEEEDEIPRRLGEFEIRRELGRGGIGCVYLAHDTKLGRDVALKVLDRKLLPNQRQRAWILNEARSLASLVHPGIVGVYDTGHTDGFDYVVIEYVEGPTLSQVIFELRRLKLEAGSLEQEPSDARVLALKLQDTTERVRCFHAIASAVAYCHNNLVIHRDIKPDNVVFDAAGNPRLIDFGLAHIERGQEESQTRITRQLVGSAAYIAPEQVEAGATGASPRSDQFSLCTLFYEALALRNPFDEGTLEKTTAAVLRCDVPSLAKRLAGVPTDLATVIHHGLARNPADRFPSVQALADDLAAILEHRPISVSPPSLAKRTTLWTRRNRQRIAVGLVGLAILCITLVSAWGTGVAATRDEIVSELSSIDVRALSSPSRFLQPALRLDRLRARAETFDAGIGRSWLGPPLAPEIKQRIDSWSQQLSAAFAEAADHDEDASWRFLFLIESEICPECVYNLSERSRGTVVLPSDVELRELIWEFRRLRSLGGMLTCVVAFERVMFRSDLPLGTYQLVAWKPGSAELAFESEFTIHRDWAPRRAIRLIDRDPEEFDRTILFAASIQSPGADAEFSLPAFRLAPSPVTTAAFERFTDSDEFALYLEEGGRSTVLFEENRDKTEPACVGLDAAEAYARWKGGRLPSNEELVVAGQTRLTDVGRYRREWIRNADWRTIPWSGAMFYAENIESPMGMLSVGPNPSRETLPRGEEFRDYPAFRIAYSIEDKPQESK